MHTITRLKDRLILPALVDFTRLGYTWRARRWPPLEVSLAGRVAVVTGATSGLGRETALQLAHLGARVIVVGRDPQKTAATQQAISEATHNPQVVAQVCDLSVLASVQALAARLLKAEAELHILVNNAGTLENTYQRTTEGLECSLATNLLAPFLLTQALMPRLQACAPARVVNVASGGMYTQRLAVDALFSPGEPFDGVTAYARQKRALVVLSEMWAQQLAGSGVVVNSMHPGWAATPGVMRALPGFYRLTRPLLRDAQAGADTIVWLAAAPEAGAHNGAFCLDRIPRETDLLPGTWEVPGERERLWRGLLGLVESVVPLAESV